MGAPLWGPRLALRKSNLNRWKKQKVCQFRMANGACQWSTTKQQRRQVIWFRTDWRNYNRDGSKWVHPRGCCIAGRLQEGELRKSVRHRRHRGIFKGKVLGLSTLVLKLANSCQARKDSGHCMLLRCLVVSVCHPIGLAVSEEGM